MNDSIITMVISSGKINCIMFVTIIAAIMLCYFGIIALTVLIQVFSFLYFYLKDNVFKLK